MTVIWWTLYILGAFTIIIVWLNLITLFIKGCTAVLKKERNKPTATQNDLRNLVQSTVEGVITNRGILSRKDIESLIRMEVRAYLSNLEISHTVFPGLGSEELKFAKKEDK